MPHGLMGQQGKAVAKTDLLFRQLLCSMCSCLFYVSMLALMILAAHVLDRSSVLASAMQMVSVFHIFTVP